MAEEYGIKVVEPGKDISTTNIEEISFHSSYPFFKIDSDTTQDLSIPANATLQTLTFSHTLGYVPAFVMYSTASSGDSYSRPIPRGVSPHPIYASSYTTSSNVIFKMKLNGLQGAFSITVRCIIFKDKIAD